MCSSPEAVHDAFQPVVELISIDVEHEVNPLRESGLTCYTGCYVYMIFEHYALRFEHDQSTFANEQKYISILCVRLITLPVC